jgi:hypothetical protein
VWGNVKRLPCKGSWTRVHERTEGLKGIALFIQIPYAPKKSLRLACGNPPPFTREAEFLRLALTRLTFLCKRGEVERREKSEQRIMK